MPAIPHQGPLAAAFVQAFRSRVHLDGCHASEYYEQAGMNRPAMVYSLEVRRVARITRLGIRSRTTEQDRQEFFHGARRILGG